MRLPFHERIRRLFVTVGLAVAANLAGCGARDALPNPGPRALPAECPGLRVQGVRVGEVEKMDLLFVVDNSSSMADKQELLQDAVPILVRRLANPPCVGIADRNQEVSVDSSLDPCPTGYRREFDAIDDMHIGLVTSSLGSHGAPYCVPRTGADESLDDHGYLLGTRPRAETIPTYRNLGFLDWDPTRALDPPGEDDLERLQSAFGNLIAAAGERGCPFESTLESWYRFLIDPKPYQHLEVVDGQTVPSGIDKTLLAQRAAFLRPDSLVVVVLLSDENDCSVIDSGRGWLVETSGFPSHMPRATSACDRDPNSPCCRSCAVDENQPPEGCTALVRDEGCVTNGGTFKDYEDPLSLRCYQQRRRFGVDLLYPTARYAVGLRDRTLCPDSIYLDGDCSCRAAIDRARKLGQSPPPCTRRETGEPVANPLFRNLSGAGASARTASQVFMLGIVGVPWQDIATSETLRDPERLEYMTMKQLSAVDPALGVNRWDVILGDLDTYRPPDDPFMRESVDARTGNNPITGDAMVPPTSTDPRANPINGHERSTGSYDLQYACIFQLRTPRDCSSPDSACECGGGGSQDNPLCQPPGGGTGSSTQYFANAYPGLRELDVLRRYGDNAIVASICPKDATHPDNDLAFGYRPALSGLIKRLRCTSLDASFDTDPGSNGYGTIGCRMIGVRSSSDACSCKNGRRSIAPVDRVAMRHALEERSRCGKNTGIACDDFCMCEIPQARGSALRACQNDTSASPVDASGLPVNGWCYVDPGRGFGSPRLVADCPTSDLRNVRLLGTGSARAGESLFVSCGDRCDAR